MISEEDLQLAHDEAAAILAKAERLHKATAQLEHDNARLLADNKQLKDKLVKIKQRLRQFVYGL